MSYEYPEQTPLMKQIEREISDYTTKTVNLGENINYSQHKLVRRIVLFETKTYPTGKFDSQGNYKFWFDVQNPLIDAEVKNIDFDTKNIEVYSYPKIDETPNLIVNLRLSEWMREKGQAEELNSAIEEGSGWGNIVWKKIRGNYERLDLRNVYVINQAAKTLKESPVIEYHPYNQTQVREMATKWKNVDQVLSKCGTNFYKRDDSATEETTTTPYYSIYERNGEVNLRDLKEQRIKLGFKDVTVEKGDSEKYVLAKIISAGTQNNNGAVKIRYVMFADEITKMPYKEYHRGRYKGKWFREGIFELTFDIQVRCNEIGNQLARGLEWASKKILYSPDKLVIQNALSDLKNGDIIRTTQLSSLDVRMEGFDQLVAEWNRLIQMARDLTNAREIVDGDSTPGQPFRLGALLNTNANKLYDFVREKIAIPISELFSEEVVPGLVDDIKAMDVLRLTGDSEMLNRLYQLIVDSWYVKNLIAIGAHSPEVAELIKQKKLEELKKDKKLFLTEFKQMFENYKPRVAVVITGENVDLPEKLQTLATFISMESDPVRRSYLIEKAMRLKGIDVGSLPRSTPEQLVGVKPDTSSMVGAGADNAEA